MTQNPSESPDTSTVLLCLGSRTGGRDPEGRRAKVQERVGVQRPGLLNREHRSKASFWLKNNRCDHDWGVCHPHTVSLGHRVPWCCYWMKQWPGQSQPVTSQERWGTEGATQAPHYPLAALSHLDGPARPWSVFRCREVISTWQHGGSGWSSLFYSSPYILPPRRPSPRKWKQVGKQTKNMMWDSGEGMARRK